MEVSKILICRKYRNNIIWSSQQFLKKLEDVKNIVSELIHIHVRTHLKDGGNSLVVQ